MTYRFTVNGEPVEAEVPGMRRLLDVLREDLGLTGTKEGCGEGECGACSVLVDGEVVDACLVPVCQVEGASSRPSRAWRPTAASTCCRPPSWRRRRPVRHLHAGHAHGRRGLPRVARAGHARRRIREAIAGNLCRCTGYTKIIDAIALAAERRSQV